MIEANSGVSLKFRFVGFNELIQADFVAVKVEVFKKQYYNYFYQEIYLRNLFNLE